MPQVFLDPTVPEHYVRIGGVRTEDELCLTTGTPAATQIATFTDDKTIEGDAGLTWNGSVFEVTGGVIISNGRIDLSDAGTAEIVCGSVAIRILNNAETVNLFHVQDGGNIGINIASPAAKLHVDQSSTTAAIPVLALDQADVSEEMMEFITTIGVGNAIEAVGAKVLTTTHFVKVTIPGGLTRYFPVGTIA